MAARKKAIRQLTDKKGWKKGEWLLEKTPTSPMDEGDVQC